MIFYVITLLQRSYAVCRLSPYFDISLNANVSRILQFTSLEREKQFDIDTEYQIASRLELQYSRKVNI